MALATTCPHCMTSFRVVPDQLKLRRGLVRCGTCRHVFSGVDYLRYVDARLRGAAGGPADEGEVTAEELHTALLAPETLRVPETILAHSQRTLRNDPPGDDTNDAADAAQGRGAGDSRNAEAEARGGAEAGDAIESRDAAHAREASDADDMGDADDTAGAEDAADAREVTDADDASDVPCAPGADRVVARIAETAETAETAPDGEREVPDSLEPETMRTASRADVPPARARDEDAGDDHSAPDLRSDDAMPGTRAAEGPAGAQHRPAEDVEWVTATVLHTNEPAPDAPAAFAARPPAENTPGEAAIDYFSRRRNVGFVDRHGALAVLAVVLLVAVLALQWAIAQRSVLAARFPALAPTIVSAAAVLGLSVEPVRELESLTIESFELHATSTPDVLELSALLRNRADHRVGWPSMQLTLTDPENRVLVRKVIGPGEYLRENGADSAAKGVPARAEWPLRLALEARDLEPANYSVVLFYP